MPVRIPDTFIKDSLKLIDYTLVSIERADGRCYVNYICSKGHLCRTRWDHWKRGDRCSVCKKINIDFIRSKFEEEGYSLLSNKYVSYNSKLKYKCPKGHSHSISWDAWINQNQRCPYCAGNAKLNIEDIDEKFKSEGYLLITKVYKNAHQKLLYKCPKNHIGHITWQKWGSGQRCLLCSNKKISINQMGFNNSNWKGGSSTEPYCDAWADKEYKESIKERDNYECQNPDCWGTSDRLIVHHIDYIKKNCKPHNLITLCNSCNSRANGDRLYWAHLYSNVMESK